VPAGRARVLAKGLRGPVLRGPVLPEPVLPEPILRVRALPLPAARVPALGVFPGRAIPMPVRIPHEVTVSGQAA
jgi:hypothetical protein